MHVEIVLGFSDGGYVEVSYLFIYLFISKNEKDSARVEMSGH